MAEYDALTSAEVEIRSGETLYSAMLYAQSVGADALVRSTTGLSLMLNYAASAYPDIQCFVPLGSNSPIEIATPTSVPVIVTCGAGDTDNDTAYGPGLEFWDLDADTNPDDDASSYSNGRICGKMLKLKDARDLTWWEARYICRQTATGAGTRTDADGYGKIDVTAALAWTGNVPDDPYTAAVEGISPIRSSGMPSIRMSLKEILRPRRQYETRRML